MRLLLGIPKWGIAKPYKMAVRNRVYFALYLKKMLDGTLLVEFMQVCNFPYCFNIHSGVFAYSFDMTGKKS